MIKQIEIWKRIDKSQYSNFLLHFKEKNIGFFESENQLIELAVLTAKKLYTFRKNLHLCLAIYIESLCGMRYELGEDFSFSLISLLSWNKPYKAHEKLLDGYHEKFVKWAKESNNKYFLYPELTFLGLNMKLRSSKESKIFYLKEQVAHFVEKSIEDDDGIDKSILDDYIAFCESHIELLVQHSTQIENIKVEKKEIRDYTFVDSLVIDQTYYILILERMHQSDLNYIKKKECDRLKKFLQEGKLPDGKKIFFGGDAKTLAYCFYQLHKFNLLNRLDDLDQPLKPKEIAKMLFDCFSIPDCRTEESIYDYIRKGDEGRPLNPIFIIEENTDKDSPFKFTFLKQKHRNKGQSFSKDLLEPFDTKILERILGYGINDLVDNSIIYD